ncbi:CLAVATA3/ESR (CLE)-related protein [Actinidia chinensis var. chinensis]|uniref:CLAVATA3/ESR (CLE)-related protein n=1 Tax=Actinidia chinensis var. chinensis TaxID=1590841 RepID=A0A2R6QC17_ACTCC|nr:CLAVATA3/ESR (CLE)-related protein [Actinidia chinensis var. chinensis]
MANSIAPKMFLLFLVVLMALSRDSQARVLNRKTMESRELFHELGFDTFLRRDQNEALLDDRVVPQGPNPLPGFRASSTLATEYRLVPGGPNQIQPGNPGPSPGFRASPTLATEYRLIPVGPNQMQPGDLDPSPDFRARTSATEDVLVPGGPNPLHNMGVPGGPNPLHGLHANPTLAN